MSKSKFYCFNYYFKIPSELFEDVLVIITDKKVTAESRIPKSKKCSIRLPVQCLFCFKIGFCYYLYRFATTQKSIMGYR